MNCPGPWSKWSECFKEDGVCEKHRNRTCDGCEGKCAAENLTLTQTEPCEECKTSKNNVLTIFYQSHDYSYSSLHTLPKVILADAKEFVYCAGILLQIAKVDLLAEN